MLDEWELLSHPGELTEAVARGERPITRRHDEAPPLSANTRAFRVMVRNAAFRRAELAARRDWRALEDLDRGEGWDAAHWELAFQPYFAEHPGIGTGADARGPDLWQPEETGRLWRARQVIDDPAGFHEWALVMAVDLDASDQLGEAVLRPLAVERAH